MFINWLPILVAAAVSFVIGWIWYSDSVFGLVWRRLAGVSEEYHMQMAQNKKRMWKLMALYFVSLLLTAWALSFAVILSGSYSIVDALYLGFLVWLGFGIPATIGSVLWEGRPWKFYGINVGYLLLALLVSSIILTLWI